MDDIPDRGETQSTGEIEDRRLITELLQNGVVWRDAGDWERFPRRLRHPDGRMMATWTQGTGDDFIAVSKEGWAKGVEHPALPGGHLHRPTGRSGDLPDQDDDLAAGHGRAGRSGRALHRALLRLPREAPRGRSGIVLRRPIYEKDRMDPVTPGAVPKARPDLARSVPGRLSPPRLFADPDRLHR